MLIKKQLQKNNNLLKLHKKKTTFCAVSEVKSQGNKSSSILLLAHSA